MDLESLNRKIDGMAGELALLRTLVFAVTDQLRRAPLIATLDELAERQHVRALFGTMPEAFLVEFEIARRLYLQLLRQAPPDDD